MKFSEKELKNFETETHLLLGIQTCAACGSKVEGCTAYCFDCLEADFEDTRDSGGKENEITTEDWIMLARRQVFYRQLERLGPANPTAKPRVMKFNAQGQLVLNVRAWN